MLILHGLIIKAEQDTVIAFLMKQVQRAKMFKNDTEYIFPTFPRSIIKRFRRKCEGKKIECHFKKKTREQYQKLFLTLHALYIPVF